MSRWFKAKVALTVLPLCWMTLAITPSVVSTEGMWFRAIISSGMFFLDFCQRACLGPRLEMGCGAGYTNSQSRPEDVLVPNWDLGKPAAFDLSVTYATSKCFAIEASTTAGSAALVAENRKHKYIMTGSVRKWVGCASHSWSRPMGVGVLQQWRPFLSSLVAFPPG